MAKCWLGRSPVLTHVAQWISFLGSINFVLPFCMLFGIGLVMFSKFVALVQMGLVFAGYPAYAPLKAWIMRTGAESRSVPPGSTICRLDT